MQEPEILFEQRGKLGLITLNRPEALNALTYGMVHAMDAQLDLWADDATIEIVAIQGAGDKAFAAGGDIRWLYDNGQRGATGQKNFSFFADEYRLNTKIRRYRKPYVALMDGIVMGGGVGVSIHGQIRIATSRTVFAMPETGIGLFPDVGAAFFLTRRLKYHVGYWIGLTGARLKGAECVSAGVCDIIVSDDKLAEIVDAMARGELPWIPSESTYLERADQIDKMFAGASVEEILTALDQDEDPWSRKQAAIMRSKSPTSTRITFRHLDQVGRGGEFEDCMRTEYRLARYCMTHPDFYEGVRAVIIDKDNKPNWSPATLAEASDTFVAEAFADLGDEELDLPDHVSAFGAKKP